MSSIKLAVILLLILVFLSLVGAFLIQVPADTASDPAAYNLWLQSAAQPKTGAWFGLLRLLGFFNIFHSIWFLATCILLICSIVICNINRFGKIRSLIADRPFPAEEKQYPEKEEGYPIEEKSMFQENIDLAGGSYLLLIKTLKKNLYSVRTKISGKNIGIKADKNRFAPLGTYLVHLSLILFVAGFLVSSYFGFRNNSFIVNEGSTEQAGYDSGLSLKLKSFTDEYWPDGTPKDYSSSVSIFENGSEVKNGIIRVNHPLSYKGVRFYQSFFGTAAKIIIMDNKGAMLYQGSVALPDNIDDNPYQRIGGEFQLADKGYQLYLVGRAENIEDLELSGTQAGLEIYDLATNNLITGTRLDAGVPFSVGELKITFLEYGQYSGFQVTKDPGRSIIWTASVLFLAGLISVFYFSRRKLDALVKQGPEGKETIYFSMASDRRWHSSSEELKKIISELQKNKI